MATESHHTVGVTVLVQLQKLPVQFGINCTPTIGTKCMENQITIQELNIIEGASGKRGQVPSENLGDHIVGIKHNLGT